MQSNVVQGNLCVYISQGQGGFVCFYSIPVLGAALYGFSKLYLTVYMKLST